MPVSVANRGGTEVVVRGQNFAPDSMVVVAGVLIENVTIQDTTTISFTTPQLPSGRTTLSVQNRGGLAQTSLLVDAVPLADLLPGFITTVAGNGLEAFLGDGGPALEAAFGFSPNGVAVDASGNLFIGDTFNHRIRRVDAETGIITTVAGSGEEGFSGDNGPAPAAALLLPTGVTLDSSGNLFIADTGNDRIRRVATDGTSTTVAGNGEHTFSGEGVAATSAAFANPHGIDIDAEGNLFIADSSNARIRRVDLETGIVTTVAGGWDPADGLGDNSTATEAALAEPYGVAVDAAGNLYIADSSNLRVREVAAADGIIRTLAGIGPPDSDALGDGAQATAASLSASGEIALDLSGNLYIADTFNRRIRKVDGATGLITTVAGGHFGDFGDGGLATEAAFAEPQGIAVDQEGHLYIADTFNQRIRKVDSVTGIIRTVAGNGQEGFSGDGGPATEASLANPHGVEVDGEGNLFISDTTNDRIRRVDATSGLITTIAGNGSFGRSGDGGPATEASLGGPHSVALDADGNIYIADTFNELVRRVENTTGVITTIGGGAPVVGDGRPALEAGFAQPRGIAIDSGGNIYVADEVQSRVRRIDAQTDLISTIAGNGIYAFFGDNGPAIEAAVASPTGVILDATGNIYVVDGERVRGIRGPMD